MNSSQPLPVGATGFFDRGVDLSEDSYPQISRAVFGAAQLLDVKCQPIELAIETSYFLFRITKQDQTSLDVLASKTVPWWALAQNNSPDDRTRALPTDFYYWAEFAEALNELDDIHLMSLDELAAPVDEKSISDLAKVEVEQIRHWKPASIGEVVFNHWD